MFHRSHEKSNTLRRGDNGNQVNRFREFEARGSLGFSLQASCSKWLWPGARNELVGRVCGKTILVANKKFGLFLASPLRKCFFQTSLLVVSKNRKDNHQLGVPGPLDKIPSCPPTWNLTFREPGLDYHPLKGATSPAASMATSIGYRPRLLQFFPGMAPSSTPGCFGLLAMSMWVWQSKLNDRRGKPQVLVHVSTYQGSVLVPVF